VIKLANSSCGANLTDTLHRTVFDTSPLLLSSKSTAAQCGQVVDWNCQQEVGNFCWWETSVCSHLPKFVPALMNTV